MATPRAHRARAPTAPRDLQRPPHRPSPLNTPQDKERHHGLPTSPKQFLAPPGTDERNSRWSDVIPPQTGLTFAAIWDPDDGMVTFSGPELRKFPAEGDAKSFDQPSTVDAQSQVLTIDRLALPATVQNSAVWALEAESGPLTFACDALMDMDGYLGAFHAPAVKSPGAAFRVQLPHPNPRSEASSLRKSLFRKLPKEARESFDWNAVARLDEKLLRQPQAAFADACMNGELSPPTSPTRSKHRSKRNTIGDEGFCEGGRTCVSSPLPDSAVIVEMNMSSKFSMTTTSTSNYVEVTEPGSPSDDDDNADSASCSSWSTVTPPDAIEYLTSSARALANRRRTLKKRRTRDPNVPASPIEVLSREKYNYAVPPPPEVPKAENSNHIRQPSLRVKKAVRSALDGIQKCRRQDDERWVEVEVKQMVVQKLL